MRRLFVSLAVLVAVLAWAGPALGGAAFAGPDPAPGARLESSPPRITLVFTEPLSGRLARATLRTAGGGEVPASVQVYGPRLRVTPSRPLERGAYIVQWHTVSTEDGHALEGTVSFGVRAPAGAAPALETGPLARGGWARILARAALYTTILLLAAALLLPLLIRRPRGWPVPELGDEGPRRAGLPAGAEPVPAGSGPPDGAMVPGGPQPVAAGRTEP